jgi:large subunit ribosomal protein L21e
MLKRKAVRQRGKVSFTRFFQKFKEGDYVAVAQDKSIKFGYQDKLQGRTGRVLKQRGSAYEVEINDLNKPKIYMIKPVHLIKVSVK